VSISDNSYFSGKKFLWREEELQEEQNMILEIGRIQNGRALLRSFSCSIRDVAPQELTL